MTLKTCTVCKLEKPSRDFGRHRGSCRECLNRIQREQRRELAKNPEWIMRRRAACVLYRQRRAMVQQEPPSERRCYMCRDVKGRDKFSKKKDNRGGISDACLECSKAESRRRREALTDGYIRQLLALPPGVEADQLIEIKRAHLALQRELKTEGAS